MNAGDSDINIRGNGVEFLFFVAGVKDDADSQNIIDFLRK